MSQPEPDREALDALVAEFRAASGYDGEVDHFAFADTPEVQTELAQLVLAGPKRATAGLHDDPDGDAPTEVGQHDAVLDGDGAPVCIIRTDEMRALPFRERDPAFAWDEGEGDRTLADWTDIHERYFERYLTEAGGTFGEDTLVSFQRISVVWPEVDAAPPLVADGEVVVRPVGPDGRAWVRTVTGEVTSDDGWTTDRCPALLARQAGRSAGVLVFVPSPERTEVVATSLLEESEGVEAALRTALADLREIYGWGAIDA